MNTAIIYATTHGTTAKVAKQMQYLLGEANTRLIDLKKEKIPDLSNFDNLIIGGSIHAGMLQKTVKDFCRDHTVELLQKPLGLFLCGMNVPDYELQMEKAFPEILRKHAIIIDIMGGEFLFEKMNFFQKLIVRKISGIYETVSKIDHEKIRNFVHELNKN